MVTVNHRFTRTPTKRTKTDEIVIHHQAGSDAPASTIHRWHQNDNGWIGIGYNYVIRTDGTVETGRPEDTIGAHAGAGVNGRSIGICITGNLEKHPPDERQIKSLVWLIKDIEKRYGKLRISGHKEHRSTSCPGRYFPMERVKQMVQSSGIKTMVNGRYMTVESKLEQGRTYILLKGEGQQKHWVELRDLSDSMGGNIQWDQASQTARMIIR